MQTVIYVSGPMTGLPNHNREAFNAEAEALRAQGFIVINPAENGLPTTASWQEHMRVDVRALTHCHRIHLLPGWEGSSGAMLEVRIAHALGMKITNAKR